MKYLKGLKIITETGVLEDRILGFDETFRYITDQNENSLPEGEVIDAAGLYAAPGLIDVHIHGSGGKDVMDGSTDALRTISASIVKNGVTAFLATTMTMDWHKIEQALGCIRKSMQQEMPGAQLLGAHLEGPFINHQFKGAQNPDHILSPDWELVKPFQDVIKIITLAPEIQGAIALITKLKESRIVVSMGHTAISYEEALEGINAGVSHCTHLFNAMTGLHHRNPGAVGAALGKDIYCELIADKIHVHPGLFEVVWKCKGPDKVILITDCIEAQGLAEGIYTLGGQQVVVKSGSARLQDGTLAGSVLRLNLGLYNFYQNTNLGLHEIFSMASLNPARELGLDGTKGSIAVGKDADFFLMDANFNVEATYIKGKCVFNKAWKY